ncbi:MULTISPECIES: resuscitation-promoting factor [unclassified Arthrobacter]|uniref:resuscitation-promoting factor n=1 Tax=unclassified Arthrobacter TaxID=235627 RepID=UPI0024C46E93|nr:MULTISPECIES: resuscitation-promoting factor [unclassified Arthrobacter]MDK1277355.1 transglycosylase family protein [Arthrobacter sp. zg.Y919]WIB03853.1 transglycosylase family protein [Arthrobacter sp. zg-Y919]
MASSLARRGVKLLGQATVMVCLLLGLVAYVGATKSVVLTVDGESQEVQTFDGTVADVLAKADVSVRTADRVTPEPTAALEDGATIEVQRARAVDVMVDGNGTTVHTTGETVADLVSELRVSARSAVSAPLDTSLAGLDGSISISTPKTVFVTVDGQTHERNTTAATVRDLLKESGVSLAAADRVSAPRSAALVNGMGLKVTRIAAGVEQTVTEPVPFTSSEVPNADLLEGEKKVTTAGVNGERSRVFSVTLVDGKEVSRSLLKDSVTKEPVAEAVAKGTKKRPEAKPATPAAGGGGGEAPTSGTWASLAQCESGGNWHINSGNGYYGGLQFSQSSWLGAGGGAYAPVASDATPEQQIAVAERLRANGGWGHWPSCSSKLGLR